MIYGNAVGGITGYGKTFILTDENGNELTGVVTDEEILFTATDNDVRDGMVYASDGGISTGTKDIPSYHSTEGTKLILNGRDLKFSISDYEYTKLQCIICKYNTNAQTSVNAIQVVIDDSVYNVQSTDVLSNVTKDIENGAIDFGITNTTGEIILIRYFTFKEIY